LASDPKIAKPISALSEKDAAGKVAGMTTETLTIVIRGRNLESLRRALAKGTVRHLQVFNQRKIRRRA